MSERAPKSGLRLESEEEKATRLAEAGVPAATTAPEAPKVEAPSEMPAAPAPEAPTALPKVFRSLRGTTKAPAPEAPAPPKTEARAEAPKGSAEHTRSFLSPTNKAFFNKTSEGAKKIANGAYEKIRESETVGKLGIAYNQFWADRHEQKAVRMKGEMDVFDMQTTSLDSLKSDLQSQIAELRAANIPGAADSLELQLKKIDQQKAGILNKKDKVQSKFEARDNKVKLYTNERDRIADTFINKYAEKVAPTEKKLEWLETCRDKADLLIAVTEAKHQDRLVKLEGMEKSVLAVEEVMRRTGSSEREIRKAVKISADYITKSREDMRKEKELLAKERAAMDKKIAKVDAKANPYRDRREEFVRVKEGRPLTMSVPMRRRGKAFEGEELVQGHVREEASPAVESASSESAEEAPETDENRMEATALISGWNEFLAKQTGKDVPVLDQGDFLKVTKLSGNFALDIGNFKTILERYYKLKKLPKATFTTAFAAFVKGK